MKKHFFIPEGYTHLKIELMENDTLILTDYTFFYFALSNALLAVYFNYYARRLLCILRQHSSKYTITHSLGVSFMQEN